MQIPQKLMPGWVASLTICVMVTLNINEKAGNHFNSFISQVAYFFFAYVYFPNMHEGWIVLPVQELEVDPSTAS